MCRGLCLINLLAWELQKNTSQTTFLLKSQKTCDGTFVHVSLDLRHQPMRRLSLIFGWFWASSGIFAPVPPSSGASPPAPLRSPPSHSLFWKSFSFWELLLQPLQLLPQPPLLEMFTPEPRILQPSPAPGSTFPIFCSKLFKMPTWSLQVSNQPWRSFIFCLFPCDLLLCSLEHARWTRFEGIDAHRKHKRVFKDHVRRPLANLWPTGVEPGCKSVH